MYRLYRGFGHFLTTNPVCERRVNLLVYSFSLYRHSYIGFILAFASSIHNKRPQHSVFFTRSRARPSHSCGGWVCDLGAVGVSSIFGLVRGSSPFAPVLPTLVLVSRIQLAQRYRGFGHFLIVASSSRFKTMVGGALVKASAFRFGLGVMGLPSCLDRALTHRSRGCLVC
jgi:hypothetical protein